MKTVAEPKHRPYRTAGAPYQIGLGPMEMAQWLDTGPDHATFMAAKRARLAGRPPLYYRTMPGSLLAQQELLATILANVEANHGHVLNRDGSLLTDRIDGTVHRLDSGQEPLDLIGAMLEEDFILFQNVDGADLVTAASNAYTSSGRIVSTVGQTMHYAHEPVPNLNAQLGPRIDRVLANIRVGLPVVRFNWFLTPFRDRLFPRDTHDNLVAAGRAMTGELRDDPSRAGDVLWVRVERQTFVRLPETKSLAFGIHTYSDPLSTLAGDNESLEGIRRLLNEYDEDRLRYANLVETRDPILRWIDSAMA